MLSLQLWLDALLQQEVQEESAGPRAAQGAAAAWAARRAAIAGGMRPKRRRKRREELSLSIPLQSQAQLSCGRRLAQEQLSCSRRLVWKGSAPQGSPACYEECAERVWSLPSAGQLRAAEQPGRLRELSCQ